MTINEPPCHQNVTNNQLQSFTYRRHTDSDICYMKPKYHITNIVLHYLHIIFRSMRSHDVPS